MEARESESEWLPDAISFSLKATLTDSNSTLPTPPARDPRLAILKEGIFFSRRLIKSYHLIIFGYIVLLSVTHWTRKFIYLKKRRALTLQAIYGEESDVDTIRSNAFSATNGLDIKWIYSSSCSTLDGTVSPPQKNLDEDEETPLLPRAIRPLSLPGSALASINALLIYQPRPIPVVNKILPSNGTSLVVLAFLALNLLYTFYHINFTFYELFVLADRCGLLFVPNLPLLYLLAAKTQPLRVFTGRSYESLNIFHRRLGELLCLLALLHSTGMFEAWYVLIRPNGFGLIRFVLLKMCVLGITTLISYEILYFASLRKFRQKWYKAFVCLHFVLQIMGLVCVYFHHHASRIYVLVALAIFLVDRLLYRLGKKSMKVEAETKILEDEESVRLTVKILQRPGLRAFCIFGKSLKTGWQATDHVFVRVPSLSNFHTIQAHPFTITSATPAPSAEEARIDLLIRAQNGFSRDLLNAARLHKRLTVRLDGPYGSSHARDMLEDSDLALLVAGGSGIAVCWPLVQHLLDRTRPLDKESMTSFAPRNQKVILVWVIHDEAHLSWLGRPALYDAEIKGADIVVPRATEEIGRPDLNGMINEIVDAHGGGQGRRIRMVASGPNSMGRLVRNTCASMVRDGKDVDVTIEKFGW